MSFVNKLESSTQSTSLRKAFVIFLALLLVTVLYSQGTFSAGKGAVENRRLLAFQTNSNQTAEKSEAKVSATKDEKLVQAENTVETKSKDSLNKDNNNATFSKEQTESNKQNNEPAKIEVVNGIEQLYSIKHRQWADGTPMPDIQQIITRKGVNIGQDICKGTNPITIIIGVCIDHDSFDKRKIIRETYAQDAKENNAKVIFFLGLAKQLDEASRENQRRIEAEAREFGDVVQGHFEDTYKNLTLKSVLLLHWAATYCSQAEFVYKVDDDVFVYIPKLITVLRQADEKMKSGLCIFGQKNWGALRDTNPNSKWYVPAEEWAGAAFPASVGRAPGYALNMATCAKLAQQAATTQWIGMDNVFVTGFAAHDAGVTLVDEPGVGAAPMTVKGAPGQRWMLSGSVRFTDSSKFREIWKEITKFRNDNNELKEDTNDSEKTVQDENEIVKEESNANASTDKNISEENEKKSADENVEKTVNLDIQAKSKEVEKTGTIASEKGMEPDNVLKTKTISPQNQSKSEDNVITAAATNEKSANPNEVEKGNEPEEVKKNITTASEDPIKSNEVESNEIQVKNEKNDIKKDNANSNNGQNGNKTEQIVKTLNEASVEKAVATPEKQEIPKVDEKTETQKDQSENSAANKMVDDKKEDGNVNLGLSVNEIKKNETKDKITDNDKDTKKVDSENDRQKDNSTYCEKHSCNGQLVNNITQKYNIFNRIWEDGTQMPDVDKLVTSRDVIMGKEICSNKDEKITLLIGVLMARKYFDKRQLMRDTWATDAKKYNTKVVFFVASQRRFEKADSESEPSYIQKDLEEESAKHGDIVQGHFVDHYKNLTLKSVLLLHWAATYCSQAEFVYKMDDDVFVYIPQLINETLEIEKTHKGQMWVSGHVYWGSGTDRNPRSKWYTPKSEWPSYWFPPRINGASGYMMPMSSCKALAKQSAKTQWITMEDVFVTGFAAHDAGVKILASYHIGANPDSYRDKDRKLRLTYVGSFRYVEAGKLPLLWQRILDERKAKGQI